MLMSMDAFDTSLLGVKEEEIEVKGKVYKFNVEDPASTESMCREVSNDLGVSLNWFRGSDDNVILFDRDYEIKMGKISYVGKCDSPTLPINCKRIYKKMFANSKISYISLENVTVIEDSAFARCEELQCVMNANSLESIGDYAFIDCKALHEIKCPDNTVVGRGAFEGCISLANAPQGSVQEDSVLSSLSSEDFSDAAIDEDMLSMNINGKSYSYNKDDDDSLDAMCYSISRDLGDTYSWCRDDCSDITVYLDRDYKVVHSDMMGICLRYIGNDTVPTLPFGCREIHPEMFKETSITSISLKGVHDIHAKSFEGCSDLMEVKDTDCLDAIGPEAFKNCTSIQKLHCLNTHYIGEEAFKGCSSLKEIGFGDEGLKLRSEAFRGTALEFVCLPQYLTEIGKNVFADCDNLEEVLLRSIKYEDRDKTKKNETIIENLRQGNNARVCFRN